MVSCGVNITFGLCSHPCAQQVNGFFNRPNVVCDSGSQIEPPPPHFSNCIQSKQWRIIGCCRRSQRRGVALSFVNLPNYITLTRIFSIPVLIWILSSNRFSSTNGERELLASFVFIAASLTDAIDGYLARKRAQVTTMGMLLDPVADKLLIAAAFITLVQFNPRTVPAWMAVIIIGREFLVSGLRSIAASEGFTIQASDLGKMKMVVQIVAVVAAILDMRWWDAEWNYGAFHFVLGIDLVAKMAIWFMVALSLISAVDYFVGFWKKIDRSSERRRRRSFVLSRRRKSSDVAAT